MTRRWVFCLLTVVSICSTVWAQQIPEEVRLAVGESRLISIDLRRAALGNGKVVSLATPEKGQLLLIGESAGTTVAQLWLRDGARRSLRITVVDNALEDVLAQVQLLLQGISGVSARIAGTHVLLEGQRISAEEQRRVEQVVAVFPGRVLNFLGQAGWESMIRMNVRLVEVRRDQLRQLGLRWGAQAAGPSVSLTAGTGQGGLSLRAATTTVLQSQIDLLQQKGMAYIVAEPTLSCRSGGVARFVSGGEVPIPVTDGLGATDVQYKEFGVILEIRPRTDRSGAVYADVDVELSQIDASVRVGDYPGFVKRRTSTAINVQSGETVALAGLVARERSRDRQGLPGLSALPVGGSLFGSTRRQSRQTELVVLITPHRLEGGEPGVDDSPDQHALIERARVLVEGVDKP